MLRTRKHRDLAADFGDWDFAIETGKLDHRGVSEARSSSRYCSGVTVEIRALAPFRYSRNWRAQIVAAQGEFDGRFEEAEFVAGVVAGASKREGINWAAAKQVAQGVGELDSPPEPGSMDCSESKISGVSM